MRVPPAVYQIEQTLAHHLTPLRPAQARGLALWVYGTVLAHSACQSAVIAALVLCGTYHGLRQRLREWLYDGKDKAARCHTQVAVEPCFAPLLRWLLSCWRSRDLALAIDATTLKDRLTVLAVSVLYRGCAIPVAWAVLPGNTQGAWMDKLVALLRHLHPAVPARMRVLVLADRGLWSPRLWQAIRTLGWHPLLRIQNATTFTPATTPATGPRVRVSALVQPGQVWIGRGWLGAARRLEVTLMVVWSPGQKEPWAVVSDLPPDRVGARWYALRMWVELGFRALKGLGWQWHKTRRTDPVRAARHWLVLAVATLLSLAHGTRAEDARPGARSGKRPISVFRRGLAWLQERLLRGAACRRLWLAPEPWPNTPPDLVFIAQGQPP
jgi:hypothetical protein